MAREQWKRGNCDVAILAFIVMVVTVVVRRGRRATGTRPGGQRDDRAFLKRVRPTGPSMLKAAHAGCTLAQDSPAKSVGPAGAIPHQCAQSLPAVESVPAPQLGANTVYSGEAEVALAFIEDILVSLGATPEQVDRERARARGELSALSGTRHVVNTQRMPGASAPS